MKFTVLIVTYHPDWKKLLVTLDSVMAQTFKDYEIVVSDDGSEENCFDKIEAYFTAHQFANYTLIPHEKNQGTVKNLIDGLAKAKGKYVRDFGPGDAFYNEHTLQQVYDFMEENQYESCFGLMRGYCRREDGGVDYVEFPHPFDLSPYKNWNEDKIVKNLVLYRDNASGECTCYTVDYYMTYLKKIEGTVIYAEDIFQMMAGLDGRPMHFFPDYLVWYEADTGVSTKKKSSFSELLAQDVDRFYAMIQVQYSDNPYVKKQKKVLGLYKIRNLYLRTLLRLFRNPDAIRYLVSHMLQVRKGAYRPSHQQKGFLDNPEFSKEKAE